MEVDTLLKPGDFKRGTVTRFALMQISLINAQWCWAFLISNSYRNRFESVCIKVACLHKLRLVHLIRICINNRYVAIKYILFNNKI